VFLYGLTDKSFAIQKTFLSDDNRNAENNDEAKGEKK
jgi:hypothetical protein